MAVSVLHETDLFRPHEDPDDHFDLACQFALAKRGLVELKGVLIDDPPGPGYGDPDVVAVAQMNALAGLSVPVGVGQPADEAAQEGSGMHLLRQTLERAREPVTLHIVGSCRDVARCGRKYPGLFREKVGAVYLNAGSGTEGPDLEYNAALDAGSYAAIFSLPCPIFWMPCFHRVPEPGEDMQVGEFGTFYRFRQADLFRKCPPRVQNYFLNVLARRESSRWFKCLEAPVDGRLLARFGALDRNMWCTGGFLHAAGLTVWLDGSLAALGEDPAREVFEFVLIEAECGPDGRCRWRRTEASNRFIYRVRDRRAYPSAMAAALSEVISWL